MKKKIMIRSFLAFLMVSFIQTGCASNEAKKSSQLPTGDAREISRYVTATATVEAIDLEKRELILRDPSGIDFTLTVDKQVKRLHEIKVGDKIKFKYYISLASEIREPTDAEKDMPVTVLEGMAKAPPGTAPAGRGIRQIRAVVTVEDIDRSADLVTLKGPLGRHVTIAVRDPTRLEKVSLGDTVIVTYTEALAVSVEKVE